MTTTRLVIESTYVTAQFKKSSPCEVLVETRHPQMRRARRQNGLVAVLKGSSVELFSNMISPSTSVDNSGFNSLDRQAPIGMASNCEPWAREEIDMSRVFLAGLLSRDRVPEGELRDFNVPTTLFDLPDDENYLANPEHLFVLELIRQLRRSGNAEYSQSPLQNRRTNIAGVRALATVTTRVAASPEFVHSELQTIGRLGCIVPLLGFAKRYLDYCFNATVKRPLETDFWKRLDAYHRPPERRKPFEPPSLTENVFDFMRRTPAPGLIRKRRTPRTV